MRKVVRLSETDMVRLIKRVLKEQEDEFFGTNRMMRDQGEWLDKDGNYVSKKTFDDFEDEDFTDSDEDFRKFIEKYGARTAARYFGADPEGMYKSFAKQAGPITMRRRKSR